jgi:predicted Holliday junction resolvase-like endonuclease
MKFLKEVLKSLLLIVFILAGVILFKGESIEAKALKIQERKGNLSKELTREERDEYMKYLRTLNNFDYESPIYKRTIE